MKPPRIFRYNSVELEDPGPEHDPIDVRNLYAATYPEILNAGIDGPEEKDGKHVYTFRKAVGTKGGTKNNPSAYDCYLHAEPDEPMFILLARDKHAPALLWLWTALREIDGEDPAKVKEARDCMLDMLKWATEHERKVVGLGTATLAGVFELIRTVNTLLQQTRVEPALNQATTVDVLRQFLAHTEFEQATVQSPKVGVGEQGME